MSGKKRTSSKVHADASSEPMRTFTITSELRQHSTITRFIVWKTIATREKVEVGNVERY